MKPDRVEYTNYPIDKRWVIRVYETKKSNDIHLQVEYEHIPIIRFDQGQHDEYHVDVRDPKTRKMRKQKYFPDAKTKEKKIDIAFSKMKEYISRGVVKFNDTQISPSTSLNNILGDIRKRITNRELPFGSGSSYRSITTDGIVIESPNKNDLRSCAEHFLNY